MKNQKIIYGIGIGILLGIGSTVFALPKDLRFVNDPNPKLFKVINDTATTTKSIPANHTYIFGTPYEEQGTCFKLKDSDGVGFTYLQVNNGLPIFSTNSCE